MTRLAILVAVLAVGCSVLPDPPVEEEVDGVTFGRSSAEPALPDSVLDPVRWAIAIQTAADFWGVNISTLRGLRVGLSSQPPCPQGRSALGCYDNWTIWLWTPNDPDHIARRFGATTCPQFAFVHEIGHFLIGDPEHEDPRFAAADGALESVLDGCPALGE
jgi:hypothetical protein